MRSKTLFRWLIFGLVLGLNGCGRNRNFLASGPAHLPATADGLAHQSQAPQDVRYLTTQQAGRVDLSPSTLPTSGPRPRVAANGQPTIRAVSRVGSNSATPLDATLTIEGRTYRVQLVEEEPSERETQPFQTVSTRTPRNASESLRPTLAPLQLDAPAPDRTELPGSESWVEGAPVDALQLNLPTALSMVGGQHPAVGFAQWRVQEAYAQLDRAQVLWLPSIQPGFSFHRHDGNYQASDGSIVDVNRNSFQYGLGAGATGAGTTPRPGIAARFHLADAIFQPHIAEQTAWARGHAANGVLNEQLLRVALAYLVLLDAEQDRRIVEETKQRTEELAKLTSDFAAAGRGLQADADRLQTELRLIENQLAAANETVDVASARLSEALSMNAVQRIALLDPTVVPIELVSIDMDRGALISTGLANRPELKEAQALVAAACEQYQRQRYAPFVPSVLLGFSTGGFGGGLGNHLNDVDGRYDFDAVFQWEVRNLGFGEGAARRETHALIHQAKFEQVRVLDQVAREVAEAHAQVVHRAERIKITQSAIKTAENSYTRNVSRIRDGQGLPLEVLQSVQALDDARRAYLKAVVEHNEAQFRLQWALGWPVFAPETSAPPLGTDSLRPSSS